MVRQLQIRKPNLFFVFGPTKHKLIEFSVIAHVGVRIAFGFEIWRREYSR